MKPYGVDREDRGCCPGHDKYPPDSYDSSISKKARAKSIKNSHSRARARAKLEVIKEIQEVEEN